MAKVVAERPDIDATTHGGAGRRARHGGEAVPAFASSFGVAEAEALDNQPPSGRIKLAMQIALEDLVAAGRLRQVVRSNFNDHELSCTSIARSVKARTRS